MEEEKKKKRSRQMEEEEKKKKTKTKTRTSLCLLLSMLPEDVIIKILLKLPVISVMRLRCVCKYFVSLTTSPTFVNLHLVHANADQLINNHLPLILISYLEVSSCTSSSNSSDDNSPFFYSWTLKQLILNARTNTSCLSRRCPRGGCRSQCCPRRPAVEEVKIPCPHRSTWVPSQFKIWGSCNGLLCVIGASPPGNGRNKHLPCIWNPCTKEFRRLPRMEIDRDFRYRDGLFHVQQHGFGYDRTMDDYKVVVWVHWSSFRLGVPSESAINVYTLGTDSWRKVVPCKPFRQVRKLQASGLYFRGALHWVMGVVDHLGPYRQQIVSFDIEAEATREVVPRPPPPPPAHGHGDEDWVLQELRGCLCLLIRTLGKGVIGVWIMKDYGLVNGCWTNILTIKEAEEPGPQPFKFDTWSSIPLRFCENGEIIILKNKRGIFVYDPNKKRAGYIIKTKDIRRDFDHFYMETYIESLVSLKTVFPAGTIDNISGHSQSN